ncbi:uncharacterized protein TNCV_3673691 [Trichonephila clavipes]|nr:uncharacterized protein TNCV_3673691 [Trichonephila clavipes]
MACERKLLESEATTGVFVLLGEQGNKVVLDLGMKEGLIPSRYETPKCKKDMRLVERKVELVGFEWRCRVPSKENPHFACRSVRKGTWISDSRLNICVILRLTSVRTAISPTLTEEFIIHPSVYSEIEKLGHAKSDVLLSESGSSLSADCGVSFPNVSVSNVIENSSYDLSHVKNFNTRNDSSSLIKDYKCNKIKITKLKLSIVREKCSDIVLCKKANGAMKTSSVEFISRSPNPLPMKSEHRRFVLLEKFLSLGSGSEGKREIVLNRRPELYRGKYRCVQPKINLFSSGLHGSTAADSVRSEWPLWHAAKSNAVFARRRIEMKLKLLDIRAEKERSRERENARGARAGVTF